MSIEETAQEIAESARDGFDLKAKLQGRGMRTKTQTIYTDEITGERLGGVEMREEINRLGMPMKVPHSWGIMGEIVELSRTEELEKKNADRIAALKEEVKTLARELERTAMDFELRAVPKAVKRDTHRAARDALGIKEKVTENHPRYDEYVEEREAQIMQRVIVSIHDRESDSTKRRITIDDARAMSGYLPDWEYAKLSAAVNELLWENTISEQAVEDADF